VNWWFIFKSAYIERKVNYLLLHTELVTRQYNLSSGARVSLVQTVYKRMSAFVFLYSSFHTPVVAISFVTLHFRGARGGLGFKPAGCGFDTRWCH